MVRISKGLATVAAFTFLAGTLIAFLLPRWMFPQQATLSDSDYAELFPFQSRYMKLEDGSVVHYVDEGRGPTLLFLHGNPASAFLYRHLIRDLRSDYRVIALDYPGFGRSTASPDYGFTAEEQAQSVVEFFDRLELGQVVVMMQDWGGPIGLNLAQQRKDRIRGLIIGNTWGWPLEGEFRYRAFSWVMGGPIGRQITQSRIGVVHLFLKRGVVRKLSDREYAAYFQPFLAGDRSGVTTFPRELIVATPFLKSLEENMDSLRDLPALIVWGEKDFAFDATFRERFESYYPRHKTLLLPNAGHFIQEDAPQEIASAIRSTY